MTEGRTADDLRKEVDVLSTETKRLYRVALEARRASVAANNKLKAARNAWWKAVCDEGRDALEDQADLGTQEPESHPTHQEGA